MPQITDREWIRSRLEINRPWTAYALADLEPGYFENTSWFCDADGQGLTLLYRGYSRPLVFCIEASGQLESILDDIDAILDVSDRYMVSETASAPLLRNRYRVHREWPTIRMALDGRHFRPADEENAERLTRDRIGAVRRLYEEGPPEFFLDQMLSDGIYFGIYEGSDLVAIAGTHIVSSTFSIAGLGNIYTRSDKRSRGDSRRVTSAVCRELLRTGIATIVLNVREENTPAIRVYDRLGFQTHCLYPEMIAGPK